MSYLGFLLLFIVAPILILMGLSLRDRQRGVTLPPALGLLPPWLIVAVLAVIALLYTTPWDNYLVATGVWYYDPSLVLGLTLGWVPVEEYLFFILQPLMTGLWLLFLARRVPVDSSFIARKGMRVRTTLAVGVVWVVVLALLLAGSRSGSYLLLELVWALPPIALQLAVGADILWHHRRLVALALVSATMYLCCADAVAINSGTWTINPELSTGIMLGGVLPVEEAIFFLLTNTLLIFGLVLGLARESSFRLPLWLTGTLSASRRQTAQ